MSFSETHQCQPGEALKVPVSILIPIKNESANLPRCLASVGWADEVFVVDSESTDGSQKIAVANGAKVVQFEFNGTWPKKKNWALENLSFSHEWVFILDADEVLPPEAEGEIARIVMGGGDGPAGYWINRRFMFMGRWLRHAYYPNWNLRLFKHRLGRYEKLTDAVTASGDNEVHEHVIVQGVTGHLSSEMDHYAFPSVEVFVEKHNRYSNWEARVALDRFLKSNNGEIQKAEVGLRRRLKRISHHLPFRPLLRFLFVYVWQRGFLDGAEGYYFARLHAIYEFLCVAKTRECRQNVTHARLGLLGLLFLATAIPGGVAAEVPLSATGIRAAAGDSLTVSGTGRVVMNLTDFVADAGSKVTLRGARGTQFVINVSAEFDITGARVVLGGGVLPSDVAFNLIGTGKTLKREITGNSVFFGTLKAAGVQLTVTDSAVNGKKVTGSMQIGTALAADAPRLKAPPMPRGPVGP